MPFGETTNPGPTHDMAGTDLCISWHDRTGQLGKAERQVRQLV
jgi:hypothetical protein